MTPPRLRGPAAGLLALALLAPGLAAAPAATAAGVPTRSLDSAEAEAEALREQVDVLGVRLAAATAAYEAARSRGGLAAVERVEARRASAAARSAAARERDALRSRVLSLYSGGGSLAVVASLLRGADPTDLATRAVAVEGVLRSDRQALRASERARQGAESATAAADAAARRHTDVLADVAVEAARLEALLGEQQRLLGGLDAEVARLLEEDARERARQEAARAAAQDVAAPASGAEVLPGGPGQLPGSGYGGTSGDAGRVYAPASTAGMACPVGPVRSFSDTWLAARSGGRRHQGTDVFAPYGSTAYAVVDGVVDRVGNGGLGGITLWIRSDSGDRFYYAHNAANLVALGDRVTSGQPVARVGKTGNAATTPPHVHFEAHPGGGPAANPYRLLRALCG